jgi:NAD(P)H-hydrate epimerase
MIKVLTSDQMRTVDRKAIEDFKIPSLILMENAGYAVSTQILEMIEQHNLETPKIIVICGKGNNAGDGYAAARQLAQNDLNPIIVSLFEEDELSGDALINHNIAKHFVDIIYYKEIEVDQFINIIAEADIIVDAIFGTGLNSPVKGIINDVIDSINQYAEGLIVSVDIPSGVNASTGMIMETAVVADYTVTFFAPKLGIILYPGADNAGEIIVSDISIPSFLEDDETHNISLITRSYASAILPFRPEDSNKGTFGSVFNIAGSKNFIGAASFCAKASLSVGAGYSTLAAPESIIPIIASGSPDLVFQSLKENEDGSISFESVSFALDKSRKCNVYLLGPGIGIHPSTINFLGEFTQQLVDRGATAVFDADALNCYSQMKTFALPLNSIITPHPAELARLMNISTEEILSDRISSARLAAKNFNTIVVLKGARTIIAEPDGSIYINPTGNSGLAKAGTGDVLSGMIAGFLAQGCSLIDSAILGVYLQGLAGDIAVEKLTEYSLISSKLSEFIPDAIEYLITD